MKNDILCAIPSYDGFVRAETAASLANMRVPDMYRMNVMAFDGYGIAHARNKMAQEALDGGYGYLLMVDSDVIVPTGLQSDITQPARKARRERPARIRIRSRNSRTRTISATSSP